MTEDQIVLLADLYKRAGWPPPLLDGNETEAEGDRLIRAALEGRALR